MDYERIHKVQMGVISPSKLRMKLLGAHNSKKKEGGNHSSRTSPSKLEEMEYAKNHLLTSEVDEEAASDSKPAANSEDSKSEFSANDLPSKERCDTNHLKTQVSRGLTYQCQPGSNLSTVHPLRSLDEDGNGYDSGHDNGSTSSFEFHRGERNLHHSAVGPFHRHIPSKWNDAEKWIVHRQAPNQNGSRKNIQQVQGSRQMNPSWMRIPPDSMIAETKTVDYANRPSQNLGGKFFFATNCLNGISESTDSSEVTNGFARQATNQREKDPREVSVQENPIAETTESVSMRDVGTEMTPIPSQDPSRTGTPLGATTPSRSPISSMPSTPKREGSAPYCVKDIAADEKECQKTGCKQDLSEKDLKIKTRQEIAALGRQLGKKNIASWASKNEAELSSPSSKTNNVDQHLKADYEARATAWEEAEKAKHLARYKQEEVKIQAWESHQRAKFEAKMRKVEVQVEQMRIRTHEKIAGKLAVTRRLVEERRADAEARKNQRAARTAQQVEQIRQTGRVPLSHFRCCSWIL